MSYPEIHYVEASHVLVAMISTIASTVGVATARRLFVQIAADDDLWIDIGERLGRVADVTDTEPPSPFEDGAPAYMDEEAVETALRPSPVPAFAPEPEADPPIEVEEIPSSSAPPPILAMTEGSEVPPPAARANGHRHPKKKAKRVHP